MLCGEENVTKCILLSNCICFFLISHADAENDGRLYGVLNVVLLQSQQGPTAGKVIGSLINISRHYIY